MEDVFKLIGRITVENAEANKNIDDTTKKAETAASKISRSFEKAGSFLNNAGQKITSAGTVMTATLTTGIAGLVTQGIKYNAEMETFQMNLTTLLGSSDKATKLLSDLKEMAATTPFETTDLISATETMIGFGISADDAQKYLGILGDISMGNSEKLSGLSLAFSQVQSTGKLMGQDLLQMINQGFNPLLYISKMTGESMAEVKERMSTTGISAQEVAEAFEYATQEGQPFFNAMENGANTISGRISTLKDNFNMLVGSLTESLLPTFEKIVDKAIELTEKFQGLSQGQKDQILKWGGIVAAIGPALMIFGKITSGVGTVVSTIGTLGSKLGIFSKLGGVITKATGGVGGLKGAFTLLTGPVGITVAAIGALIGAFAYLYNTNEDFRTQMQELGSQIMNSLKPVLDIIISTIKDLAAKVMPVIMNAIQTLMPVIAQVITIVAELVAQLVTTLAPVIVQIIETLAPLIATLIEKLIPVFTQIIQTVAKLIESLMPLVQMIIETLIPIFTQIVECIAQIIEAVMPVIEMIINTIMPIISELVTFISEQITMIVEFITPIIQAIVSFIQDNMDTIKSVIQTVTNIIKNIIETVMGVIQGIIKVVTGIIKGDWQQVWEGIKQIFTSVWNGIKTHLSNVIELIKSIISIAWNAIKTVTSNKWNEIKNAVSNVVTGVKDKIVNTFNTVKDKVTTVWNSIKTAIETPINKAKETVLGVIEKIKGAFNFSWSLPHLNLPHISVNGGEAPYGIGGKGTLPSFKIDWYAKAMNNPMILDEPTAFGMSPNGNIRAGGEAGAELVGGASTVMSMISSAVSNNNASLIDRLQAIIEILIEYLPVLARMQLVLETGVLVGEMAPAMDEELGKIKERKGRGR